MLKSFVYLTIFVAFLFQFANSLSCYHCNSNLNEGCDEMQQPIEIVECKSNKTARRNHQKLADALKVPMASQSAMFCLRVFLKDRHGDQQSYRECYEDFKVFSPCEMVTKSLTADNDHIRVEDCEVCDRDLCNGDKLFYRNDANGILKVFPDFQFVFSFLGVIFWNF